MNKLLKYSLWTLLGVLAVLLLAVAYITATFNPNDYKAQLIQLVKDKKQRTLKLDGDIKLSFFPNIGVRLEKISLSEFNSDKEFAAIDSARVSVAVLPLLARQLVVDEVAASGVKLQVVKFKNGAYNFDDLAGKTEVAVPPTESVPAQPAAAVAFDIAAVKLEKTGLSYRDEAKGAQYELKDINLKSGRIANNLPVRIDASAVLQANSPKVDIATQLETILTFDLQAMRYKVEALDLQVRGSVLDISNLELQASGDASANLSTQEYTARKLSLTASGVKGKDRFDAKLNVPELSLTKDKFSADKLTLKASLDGEIGKLEAALALLDLQGNAQSFKSSALTLDVDLQQPEQAFKIRLTTPLVGSMEAKQINLSDLLLAVSASGDKLPNKSVSSEMKGSVQVDAGRQSVQVNLAGALLQSQIKAKLALNGFANPAIRYDLDLDQLDADLYLPKKTAAAPAKAEAPAAAEQPFDLSGLQKLNVEGSLRIGKLKVMNVQSSQLRVDVKAHNGQINVSPLSANLYQGSVSGSIALNAAAKMPGFALKQELSGIEIGPLLKDALNLDMLEGKGNVNLNLATQGNTVSALKKGLNGAAALNLADGAVKGINIAKKLREFGGRGGDQTESANKGEKTDFSEMKASFKIKNGVAHNEDLSLKSPLIRVSGKGDIDIGNDSIDYLTKATLAGTLEGQGGREEVGGLTVPVRLSGPYTDLKYKIEFGSLISEGAKQKIESKKEELKSKVQEQLQDRLKGLLR
jgi:AsmA protein